MTTHFNLFIIFSLKIFFLNNVPNMLKIGEFLFNFFLIFLNSFQIATNKNKNINTHK